MTTAAVRAEMTRGVDTVIVPVGANENHGPHAPMSTDTIVAEEVAIRLAAKIDALVAPSLPFSFSHQHLTFAGSISLSIDTLVQVLCEVVESLTGQGFRRFVLFSGHGGNRTAIDVAARELKARHGNLLQVMVLNLLALQTAPDFRARVEASLGVKFEGASGKPTAASRETSAAMARDERLVHLDQAPPAATGIGEYVKRTRDPYTWIVTFDLPRYSAHGSWGDPRKASAEQGRVVFEVLADMLADRIDGKWEELG